MAVVVAGMTAKRRNTVAAVVVTEIGAVSDVPDRVRQNLISNGQLEIAALLEGASVRIVKAPEIGCMAVVGEHLAEIDGSPAFYARMQALTEQQKTVLVELLLNGLTEVFSDCCLVDVDFGVRG